MADVQIEWPGALLKATARSVYLSLRVLPAGVRAQMGLAYLLARTTDTIADTEIVPVEQRLAALRALAEQIAGTAAGPLNLGELALQQGQPAERELLEQVGAGLTALRRLAPGDVALVRTVLAIITSGQELDLRRFAGATGGRSSPCRRRRSSMIIRIGWRGAWGNFGRGCAGRICFRGRGWTTGGWWRRGSGSARGCSW